ncbi:protein LEKR1 [Cololabis saira]|uniref:protein LEKR1 n=1 Tax=Cololabis saira TaxID=129043 RepID=UPI002AD306C5|nr:protein LEKR1 [Cololabis saira]
MTPNTSGDDLIESHDKALTKMEEDNSRQLNTKLAAALKEHRSQIALHLRKREELQREAELELKMEREKNQMLLLQCQQRHLRIQQKLEETELHVQDLQGELHQERRRGKEKRTRDEQRWRREEETHQQQARELSQAKAEVQQMKEKNAELIEEVALLQETVRGECEEREELTAALLQARQELCGQRSLQASHQHSSRNAHELMDRQTQSMNNVSLHSQARTPLTRSSTSPNTLRSFPACTDQDKGLGEEGGRAGGSLESWKSAGALGGGKTRAGTLPRLKASTSMSDMRHKVGFVMGRKGKLRKNHK